MFIYNKCTQTLLTFMMMCLLIASVCLKIKNQLVHQCLTRRPRPLESLSSPPPRRQSSMKQQCPPTLELISLIQTQVSIALLPLLWDVPLLIQAIPSTNVLRSESLVWTEILESIAVEMDAPEIIVRRKSLLVMMILGHQSLLL